MTDWRKLLVDEHLWDYRCKAVPVPLVREIVEEVETLRQDLASAIGHQALYQRRDDAALHDNTTRVIELTAMLDKAPTKRADDTAVHAYLHETLGITPKVRASGREGFDMTNYDKIVSVLREGCDPAQCPGEREAAADAIVALQADLAAAQALLTEANEMLAEAIVCGPKLREYAPLRQRINAALAGKDAP